MPEPFDPIEITVRGEARPSEVRWIGGSPVVVHYDDLPDSDVTSVRGIPCTTPLRTVIDLAPRLDQGDLERMVRDCLDRRLFTIDEAKARLDSADMLRRPGALLVRVALGLPDARRPRG
jgi:hypothetical protein